MFEGSDSVISVSRQLARLTGADYKLGFTVLTPPEQSGSS
jgi:hypothetical protein